MYTYIYTYTILYVPCSARQIALARTGRASSRSNMCTYLYKPSIYIYIYIPLYTCNCIYAVLSAGAAHWRELDVHHRDEIHVSIYIHRQYTSVYIHIYMYTVHLYVHAFICIPC